MEQAALNLQLRPDLLESQQGGGLEVDDHLSCREGEEIVDGARGCPRVLYDHSQVGEGCNVACWNKMKTKAIFSEGIFF